MNKKVQRRTAFIRLIVSKYEQKPYSSHSRTKLNGRLFPFGTDASTVLWTQLWTTDPHHQVDQAKEPPEEISHRHTLGFYPSRVKKASNVQLTALLGITHQ